MVDVTHCVRIRDQSATVGSVRLTGRRRFVIGRAPDADIRLADENVSRRHAELVSDPSGRWRLQDLRSRNGTWVNGERIEQTVLRPGDLIQIDRFLVEFSHGAEDTSSGGDLAAPDLTVERLFPDRIQVLADFPPPRIEATHMGELTDLAARLLVIPSPEARLELLCEVFVGDVFDGDIAMILRADRPGPDAATPAIACGPRWGRRGPSGPNGYHISQSVLRACLERRTAVVGSNMDAPERDEGVLDISMPSSTQAMAAVACPLGEENPDAAILYCTFPAECGTDAWLALASLAVEQYRAAEAAWQARERAQVRAVLESELAEARRIQMSLVPRDIRVDGVEIAIYSEPCQWVGGDYVDCVECAGDAVFFCIMDVSGHGLSAALTMTGLHAIVHTHLDADREPIALMRPLGTYLSNTLPDQSFVTSVCFSLDRATGQLAYANAGHPPPISLEEDGTLSRLPNAQQPPLGTFSVPLTVDSFRIEPGQIVLAYTDGVSETIDAVSGNMLGIEGVERLLLQAAKPGGELSEISVRFARLVETCQAGRQQNDDRTYLLLRRT